MYTPQSVAIDKTGIEMFIGPLEAAIMRAMWAGESTSPKIWRHVRENYKTDRSDEIAYTSVTSTLHRLAMRNMVTRSGDKRAYKYAPAYPSETAFVSRCINRAVWALLHSYAAEFRTVLHSLAQGDSGAE